MRHNAIVPLLTLAPAALPAWSAGDEYRRPDAPKNSVTIVGRKMRIAQSKTAFFKVQAGCREREFNVNVRRESIFAEVSLKKRF